VKDYTLRETQSERGHSMATNVNVECESEHVHSVVWYRVKGFTMYMDVTVDSVVWYNVMVWHSDCGFLDRV
jgi:hypothetical protein